MSRFFSATLCLLWLSAAATPALAQDQATLSGTIADATGAVLPGAIVEAVVNGEALAVATAGPDGTYRLTVPVGTLYRLRVSLDGFAVEVLAPVIASGDADIDVALEIGALNDSVVVTASGTERTVSTVAESVSVFTGEDLQAIGATSVADALRMIPGLNVEATGREGGLAALFSRGGESDYNLVLIDGVRVNISGGQFDFSRIAAGEIERVEVVRGSQSALYGSDAIGAVIQIFTKRGAATDAPRLSGSFEGGSFNTMRGGLNLVGGVASRLDYRAGVAVRGTDGAFADLLPEDDRFDETTFNLGLGAALSDRVSVRTGVRYADARGRAVGPVAYESRDTGTVYNSTSLSWNLESDHVLAPAVTGTARLAYFRYDANQDDTIADASYNLHAILAGTPGATFPDSPRLVRFIAQPEFDAIAAGTQALSPGQLLATTPFGIGDFPFSSATEFRRPTFDYSAAWTWRPDQVLTVGYAYEKQSNPLSAGFEIANHAYFAQQQLALADDWFMTLGARVDHSSHSGANTSPKVAVGGYPVPFTDATVSSVKVFASMGRGIKNPTFSELFGGSSFDGDMNLAPETALTGDAGVEVTFDRQRVRTSVTYFNSKYEDQVAFSSTGFGADGLPDFVNVAGSEASGWELEAALQRPMAGLTGGVTYAYVDTQVTATVSTSSQFQPGQPLLRRPKHSGTVRVGYANGPARVNLDVRMVGQRHDSAFLFMQTVPTAAFDQSVSTDITLNPGYTVVGLGAEVDVHEAMSLFFRADNLADEVYESALGYPGTPRSFVVGTRFVLGR
jgi:outer membrane cobalamin receptor